jgi:pimeloyl-ACP methyl ester carboxylesterase
MTFNLNPITKKKVLQIKFVFFLLIVTFINTIAQNEYPNLDDQSGGIADGYGAWGNYEIVRENGVEVPTKGIITLYHTNTQAGKKPTVFFISGWGRTADSYDKFFRFIVSHGYTLVNIYNYDPGTIETSYPNAYDMIKKSAIDYDDWINTHYVGLMGHSFGGGAAIWVGDTLFGMPDNWGDNGRFIFTSAPWLTFLTTKEKLQTYPPNVKLHIQVNMDDVTSSPDYTWNTDPRAIRAVFELINIPDEDKDYVRVFSDTERSYVYNGATYTYDADHYLCYPGVDDGTYQPYDELDVYAINRIAHAMMDYIFEGNEAAKDVALGNGSNEQIDMGNLPDLEETDRHIITRDENQYEYRCSETAEGSWGDPDIWFLSDFCYDQDSDGLIDSLEATDNIVYLNAKVFLEGPYDVNNQMQALLDVPLTSPYSEDQRTIDTMPNDIVDWVLVQLRKSANGNAVVSKSVLLRKDGQLVDDNGTTIEIPLNAPDDNYYIVIKHRNHLSVMSAVAQPFGSASVAHYNIYGIK